MGPTGRGLRKIQAICNEKTTPSAMQGLATTGEKPPAQEQWGAIKEQWGAMEKTMGRAIETGGNPGDCLRPIVGLRDRRRRCA
jgi:hypothetical protein